jgi:TfoX N-terminal domain
LLALNVLLAHSRTLARTNRDRELALAITIAAVAYDEDLADRIRELVSGESGLTEQKMFGGLAFLIGGNMAVAASGQGGILVRVEPGQSDMLVATTNARLMEMRGRSMQGWLRVDPEDVRTKGQLAKWVELGTAYAGSLPAKR